MVPGKMVPGMGGAMDLVSGAKRVIIAMQHTAKGRAKIVRECNLPLTSSRPIDLLVTELAVIGRDPEGLVLLERAPGVSVEQILAATEAPLRMPSDIPEMALSA
jgi:acetate CoA/acetoacetate CoA-transferase beta subunit